MPATVIETTELLQTVAASLIAGVGVAVAFSLMILGATRLADMRRDDRPLAATAFGLLMALGLLATAAGIVFGLIVMTQK